MFLCSLFPGTHKYLEEHYQNEYHGYVTAEHIYHYRKFAEKQLLDCCGSWKAQQASFLGIDVKDETNGLPMLKHIEGYFQDGRITLVPVAGEFKTGTTALRVYVSTELHKIPLQWILNVKHEQKDPPKEDCVENEAGNPILLGFMHNRIMRIQSAKISLRSLYMQARMAYGTHESEFPNPDEPPLLVLYNECPAMTHLRTSLAIPGVQAKGKAKSGNPAKSNNAGGAFAKAPAGTKWQQKSS
eukprot:1953106-Amphidinium_carterae.1